MLVEVRCPNKRTIKKYGKELVCNWLCVKVEPPSKGEAYCTQCKQTFEFDIARGYNYEKPANVKIKVEKSATSAV